MSWIGNVILSWHNWRNGVAKIKQQQQKTAAPLRMGVLSAAGISPAALFDPIATHPDVILVAIAARSQAKAETQIRKQQLTDVTAFGSYDALLADASIDAVYIPLPNGLHVTWALKALAAGKHVLIEKPIGANAAEVATLRTAAAQAGKVVVEAFHWRFHPAAHVVKSLVADHGAHGAVQSVHARMCAPVGALAADDIRLRYDLAGGACMDLTYVFSVSTYFATPTMHNATYSVTHATARLGAHDKRCDEAMLATYTAAHPGQPDVTCTVDADLRQADRWLGIIPKFWTWTPLVTIELEKARIVYNNFAAPWASHSIDIHAKDAQGRLTGARRRETCYAGGPMWGKDRGQPWWTTYRYQLEAFVEQVRRVDAAVAAGGVGAGADSQAGAAGRETEAVDATGGVEAGSKAAAEPGTEGQVLETTAGEKGIVEGAMVDASGRTIGPWMSLAESEQLMELIDQVYDKAGLPKRGADEP